MEKEVKISRSKSNFNLIIFNLLKSGKTIKEICVQLNLSKHAISYHIRQLKESGSIKKIGYGVWETSIFKEKQVKIYKVGESSSYIKPCFENKFKNKDIRGHGFKFRIRLPKLYNWNKRIEFMGKNKIKFDIINKGFSQRILFRNCKTWLSDRSIVVYFPKDTSFFSSSAKDNEERAVFEIIEIMKGLEVLFNVSFKINKVFQIKIFGKHQANIRNALARMYNDDKKKLAVANSEGQWLLIDDSFNLNELETTGCNGKNDATKDMDEVIKPFFNSLKEIPFTAFDFKNLFDLTSKAVENQDKYSENVALHLKVMQEIRDALKDIRDIKK